MTNLVQLKHDLRRERDETARLRAICDDRRDHGLDVEAANLAALASAARALKIWQTARRLCQ